MLCTLLTKEEFDNACAQEDHFFVYKYNSKSCPISNRTLYNLLDLQRETPHRIYFVDVIASKPLSVYIGEILNVRHESPQIISIKKGTALAHTSHMHITEDRVKEQL